MTDVRSQLPAAGWYPDPTDASSTRWWDGLTWTTHVAPVPIPAAAIPAAAVAPASIAAEVSPADVRVPSPSAHAWTPEQPWSPDFARHGTRPAVVEPAAVEPVPYRPFADRDARYPLAPEATPAWHRGPTPNPAATRAAIAAALVTVVVGGGLALNIPVGVPLIGTGIAIVFGILGIARSRTTLSGLKRSIAALVVGVVALIITLFSLIGAIALASIDYTADVETSLVDLYNSLEPGITAVSADCAQVDLPRDGDTIPCTLALADGGRLEVVLTITSDSGSYIADIPA